MSQILLSSYPFVYSNAYSLLFASASSEYATLGAAPLDTNADFTLEMWVKLSSDGVNTLFSSQTDGNNYWLFIAYNTSNGLCFQEAVASAIATFICDGSETVAVADGWTHVALTRSGDDWTVYKNGVAIKTENVAVTGLSTANHQFAALDGAVFYDGRMDEVRIWDVARTAEEILGNMNRNLVPADEPNLTGYWRFEEGSGTTAADETAAGNDASLINTPTFSADVPY